MNPEPLPESARRAFDCYPQIEPSSAFNRAVLEALALEQSKRRQTFVGRIEEFLGVGLWSFAASGALGAFVPAVILGALMLSGGSSSSSGPTPQPLPLSYALGRYAGPLYARELEHLRRSPDADAPVRPDPTELSCFPKSPLV